MFTKKRIYLISVLSALTIGCSTNDSQSVFTSAAPRQSSTLATPPGLNTPDINTTYKMNQANQLDTNYQLNNIRGMHVMTGGSQRWLVIESSNVNDIWPELKEYVTQLGLTVKYQNRSIGVMQTDWATRNNKVPQGASIRGIFQWIGWGSMYSLDSMYMFHITVWQDGNNVIIMDTNYQMDEEYEGCRSPGISNTSTYASSEQQRTKWVPRGSNPQLELEFIMQFMAFMGTPEVQVQTQMKQVVESAPKNAIYQNNSVIVNDQFDRTWWRTAIALDRVGLGVADKNRTNGEYDVYPLLSSVDNPDPGFLTKWFSDESGTVNTPPKSKYKVMIAPSGNQTIITIKPYGSEEPDFAKEQKKYLEGIAAQLQ